MLDAQPALIRTAEAAKFLGVPVKTVRRAVHRGELHAVAIGREMFFQRAEIDRFVADLPAWPARAA